VTRKKKEKKTRVLWVCTVCGKAYCCRIPSLNPPLLLWCDAQCRFQETDSCTKLKGYSGNPEKPYKVELKPSQLPPFIVRKDKCLEHCEEA
jgi:hypothetical protein